MWRYGIFLAVFVLAAGVARADESPPPEKFFSLSAPRHLPDGKVTVPLRDTPHFLPLAGKSKFFPLPRHAGPRMSAGAMPRLPSPATSPAVTAPAAMPKAESANVVATNAAPSDDRTGMTREQAHQILSLFSSTR